MKQPSYCRSSFSCIFQPIASDDVADAMADVALGKPLNGTIEIAGPERAPMTSRWPSSESGQRSADGRGGCPRDAISLGSELNDQSLVPGGGARLGKIGFEDWFRQSQQPK